MNGMIKMRNETHALLFLKIKWIFHIMLSSFKACESIKQHHILCWTTGKTLLCMGPESGRQEIEQQKQVDLSDANTCWNSDIAVVTHHTNAIHELHQYFHLNSYRNNNTRWYFWINIEYSAESCVKKECDTFGKSCLSFFVFLQTQKRRRERKRVE